MVYRTHDSVFAWQAAGMGFDSLFRHMRATATNLDDGFGGETKMNKNQDMQTEAMPSMPMREKYWEEKGIEDRVESCGNNIEQLHRRIGELEKHLMLLSKHSHTANGEMLVPLKDKEYALQGNPTWSPINRAPR